MHVNLRVFDGSGTEPVHVEDLGQSRFRILYSPGFVDGVAAADQIELTCSDGGNLAIHVFSETPVAPLREQLDKEVGTLLHGRVDGGVERVVR